MCVSPWTKPLRSHWNSNEPDINLDNLLSYFLHRLDTKTLFSLFLVHSLWHWVFTVLAYSQFHGILHMLGAETFSLAWALHVLLLNSSINLINSCHYVIKHDNCILCFRSSQMQRILKDESRIYSTWIWCQYLEHVFVLISWSVN